ncbi:MAG: ATP-binding cassette domain-containing protein [Catenulispora sp.]|nr:ATP-binding cassette domain-containing protein [Catenulispora sp.]
MLTARRSRWHPPPGVQPPQTPARAIACPAPTTGLPARRQARRVIEAQELTKHYGRTTAVDRLTFTVRPGHVTGFLGPNGSGKSTTLRLILGLHAPDGGRVTVGGQVFRTHRRGLRHVGALLDATDVHGGRTARDHLAALAWSNGLPRGRVPEVLGEVGLDNVARRRIGGFSLGMKQRLGIAAALLGDPPVLVFDEPFNGLDVAGIAWVRGLFRRLAGEGRTVFVSSHLMSEMAQSADRLVVIGRGTLLADESVEEFAARGAAPSASLEDVFMELTADRLDYLAGGTP